VLHLSRIYRKQLTTEPGTYAVVLRSTAARQITIGKAGTLQTVAGYYLYVGSAHGSGGLRARVGRHLEGGSAQRWHIDYLRAVTTPIGVWLDTGANADEHRWAAALARLPGTTAPLRRFGASDCRCDSHLYFAHSPPDVADFKTQLENDGPKPGIVAALWSA